MFAFTLPFRDILKRDCNNIDFHIQVSLAYHEVPTWETDLKISVLPSIWGIPYEFIGSGLEIKIAGIGGMDIWVTSLCELLINPGSMWAWYHLYNFLLIIVCMCPYLTVFWWFKHLHTNSWSSVQILWQILGNHQKMALVIHWTQCDVNISHKSIHRCTFINFC